MQRSDAGRRGGELLLLGADGFLLGAGLNVTVIGLLVWLTSYLPPQYSLTGDAASPPWVEMLSAVTMGVLLIGVPLLIWRLHGRRFSVAALSGMVVGAWGGGALTSFAILILGTGVQALIGVGPDAPPYAVFGVAGLLGLFFAALPVIEAIRDLRRGPPNDRRLDWLRLAAFVAFVGVGGAFIWVGVVQKSEAVEGAAFAILFGASTGFAMVGGEVFRRWRDPASAGGAAANQEAKPTPSANDDTGGAV